MASNYKISITAAGRTESDTYAVTTEQAGPWIDIPLTANQTNKELELHITLARLKGLFIKATTPTTIKSNVTAPNEGVDGNTITVGPGGSYVWVNTMLSACEFTVDVVKLFLSETSGAAGTVSIWMDYDPTP